MGEVLVSVQGLGKRYRITHRQQAPYSALRDVIADRCKALFAGVASRVRRPDRLADAPPAHEDFWALRNVSFELRAGEILGVVGRNGAGKSTLLKVLSRITEPTEGRAVLNGRLASLLEVGTGFHPELSGGENIYLNGAILGMSRVEIRRKFDDIVSFAEIERFIDTPVKRYSSGMYVRLAFAVAAHLEPEILIVDEVLAVGDSRFQKKCIGKIEQVGGEGRAVIIVSHNMATITGLCRRALWLSGGEVRMDDAAERVASSYLREGADQTGDVVLGNAAPDARFVFERVTLMGPSMRAASVFDVREPIAIRIEYEARDAVSGVEVTLRLYNASGVPIFSTNRSQSVKSALDTGRHSAIIEIPALFLYPGSYTIDLAAHVPHIEVLCHLRSVAAFHVEETGSAMALYAGDGHGVVLLNVAWQESRRASSLSPRERE